MSQHARGRRDNRVFYVLYIGEDHQRRFLDTIRFLANPSEKVSAHVTVRGPYRQRHAMPSAQEAIRGADISVSNVDCFFADDQNTVFLECKAPELRRVWNKPDYPDYRPHITIYDGKSRTFASRLMKILDELAPRFSFKAVQLEPLVAAKGQHSIDLAASYDRELVAAATGRDIDVEEVQELTQDDRLSLIAGLCRFWSQETGASTSK